MAKNNIAIIFDNGGGITLQIVNGLGYRFQHTYNGAEDQCASDIYVAAFEGFDFADSDGNEAEEVCEITGAPYWLEPSDEDVRNGGYRIMTLDEFRDINPESTGMANFWRLHKAVAESIRNGQEAHI